MVGLISLSFDTLFCWDHDILQTHVEFEKCILRNFFNERPTSLGTHPPHPLVYIQL